MANPNTTTAVGAGAGNDSAPRSQQETGGNGGEQLTHGIADTNTDQRVSGDAGSQQAAGAGNGSPATADTAATAANRTAQDTHGAQAGSTGTGLGAAQTGGNQDEFDMPKE